MNRTIIISAFLLAFFSAAAQAGATLHIGSGYGTTCATGNCPIYGSEVNNIVSTFDIYQNSASAPALKTVDLILGVANSSASADSAIINSILSATLIDTYGNQTSVSTAFDSYAGLMTSSDVYSFLGFKGADKSNSFRNWSAAALAVDGIHASNFGIYVFSLDTANFSAHDYINLSTNLLPEGAFAVSYGLDSSGKAYYTAFTNSGMRDRPVPEPMTLALVGLGLVAIGFTTRKKFFRNSKKG